MALLLFANNATTTLAGGIASNATSFNVAAGTGALFPSPTTGQFFEITFVDNATKLLREVVYVTSRSGDTFSGVTRGQESTTARAWIAGDLAQNFWTAGSAAIMVQAAVLQQQPGNYAADTGSANAYAVTLNPVPASLASIIGSPIRVLIANTNTGASTLTVNGLASTLIRNPDGTGMIVGQLIAGGIAAFMYDGTAFEIQSVPGFHPGFTNGGSFGPGGALGGPGTTSWTAPAGVTRVRARVWGAGGPGGGSAGTPAAASGGGAGGYAEGIYTVTPGQVISVTAGAVGTPGGANTNANGTSSGNSAFGAFCSATAGTPGLGAATSSYQATAGSGGAGTGGNVLNINGSNGMAGVNIGSVGLGGGGGSAFSGAGSHPTTQSSQSAAQPAGGGGGGGNGGAGGAAGAGIVILDW